MAIALVAGLQQAPLLAQPVPPSPARFPAPTANADWSWAQLSDAQRQALAPLESDWGAIDSPGRKRWLRIARNYPKMKPEAQQRAQLRMREWALATPEQRRVARDSYARLQALSPAERAELLERYRALPEETKKRLAAANRAHKKLAPNQPASGGVSKSSQNGEAAKATAP